MGITLLIISMVVVLAILGFVGHKAAQHGFDGHFWTIVQVMVNFAAMIVMLVGNFVMCKTGLDRLFGAKESYKFSSDVVDQIGTLLFGPHKTAVTPFLAFAITAGSLMAAAKLFRIFQRMLLLWRTGGAHASEYVSELVWVLPSFAVLALDAYILVIRTATMLRPDLMARGFDNLPSIASLASGNHASEEILRFLMFGYPCLILLVESHFSSAWARFMEESRGFPVQDRRPPILNVPVAQAPIAHAAVAPANLPIQPPIDPIQEFIQPVPPAG